MLVPPAQFGKVVTPTDTTTTLFQNGPARGFYIGGAGTITIQRGSATVADGAMGDHCHLSTPRQPTKAQYIDLIESLK